MLTYHQETQNPLTIPKQAETGFITSPLRNKHSQTNPNRKTISRLQSSLPIPGFSNCQKNTQSKYMEMSIQLSCTFVLGQAVCSISLSHSRLILLSGQSLGNTSDILLRKQHGYRTIFYRNRSLLTIQDTSKNYISFYDLKKSHSFEK